MIDFLKNLVVSLSNFCSLSLPPGHRFDARKGKSEPLPGLS